MTVPSSEHRVCRDLDGGGFDIIIGNPYVRQEDISDPRVC